jgi:hypothetical protein
VALVGLITIKGFAFPETVFAAENDLSATITVLVYNNAQARPAILTGAEHEAGPLDGMQLFGMHDSVVHQHASSFERTALLKHQFHTMPHITECRDS